MSHISYDRFIRNSILDFIRDFSEAREIFTDEKKHNNLSNPGEYGSYREELCKDFLKLFLPPHLAIGDGAVINANGETSAQCDIIIYDQNVAPFLTKKRFFPIECVLGVGEIKSDLSNGVLKEALGKLSKIKKMAELGERSQAYPYTFLIAKKFTFPFNKIEEYYVEEGSAQTHKHNVLLAFENGLSVYETPSFQKRFGSVIKETGKKIVDYPLDEETQLCYTEKIQDRIKDVPIYFPHKNFEVSAEKSLLTFSFFLSKSFRSVKGILPNLIEYTTILSKATKSLENQSPLDSDIE